jgi:HlyD family secretion protein
MKTISQIIVISLITLFVSSCSNDKQVDAYGNFEDDALTVSAESMGKIISFNIGEGQVIKAKQEVAVIDTLQLHLKKEILLAGMKTVDSKARSVETQISVLKEQLALQETNQQRIEKMFKDEASTQKQVDDINAEIKITKQRIKNISTQSQSVLAEKQSMHAQVDQLNDLIQKNKIKSPITGTVLETYVKQGEFTAPGKPLFSIQDTKNMSLRAYISEIQLAQIKVNQKVKIEVDYGRNVKSFEGAISWISDKSEFTPKQIQTKDERKNLVYAVKIKVDNKSGELKIGMPASVIFE